MFFIDRSEIICIYHKNNDRTGGTYHLCTR